MSNSPKNTVHTTCAYCGVGCGIEAKVSSDPLRLVDIAGLTDHPANLGRLCSKGSALGETVGDESLLGKTRLLHPEIEGQRVSWPNAISEVAAKFKQTIEQYGSDSVAFYVSGQLLTEDYYVANKLMKGFIGSANIDTNSRLCMSSAVSAYKRAFGEDLVPGCYEDLEQAELIVLTGSNTAWCHPVLFQRIKQAKQLNTNLKIVVIDPRKTDTCDIADLHLPIKPGSDVALFNGLLAYLAQNNHIDENYIQNHTEGFETAKEIALNECKTFSDISAITGLETSDLQQFYQWFADTEKVVTAFSQGINQSTSGTDKGNAIINCHLATGKIGKPGANPFSLTGQPNAMGGREVGGLANQLAAHMDFDPDDINRVARFWQADNIAKTPGLKAVDMFKAVESGQIKAIWIMATNPAVSLPDADRVRSALRKCEFVVVSDSVRHTDTTACANVLLPAQDWGEKDGTVTNSERRISRQRRFLTPLGEAKADWWIMTEVAKAMKFGDAFSYDSPHDIFVEHAKLSAFENSTNNGNKERFFNLEGFCGLSSKQYDALKPTHWPVKDLNSPGSLRLFTDNRFRTSSGKAQIVSTSYKKPANSLTDSLPLILNTGRVRDQWHTMTRTALSARLNKHKPEPYVEMNPVDAKNYQIQQGDLVTIRTQQGVMTARADVKESQQKLSIFIPMHWSEHLSSQGRVGALVNPVTDPVSGQPESKHTPAGVEKYTAQWNGFVLSRRCIRAIDADYQVMIPRESSIQYQLADKQRVDNWPTHARNWLCGEEKSPDWLEYIDQHAGAYRGARLVNGALESVIFISEHPLEVDTSWLISLFDKTLLDEKERQALLSGKPPSGVKSVGKIICACFNVGEKTIEETVQSKKLSDAAQVGECLGAGTNCGSCVPEIKEIIARTSAD